jgi:ribosome biogenesis protein SSF1/2
MNSSEMGAYSSESEIEDLPGSKIVLPDDYQDKKKNTSVAIRLHELGPRLKLSLVKIVEGLCRGNVVYHAFQTKTPAEVRKQIDSIKSAKELKEKRKRIQEENVRRKQEKLQKAEEEIARVEDAAANADEDKDDRAGNKRS